MEACRSPPNKNFLIDKPARLMAYVHVVWDKCLQKLKELKFVRKQREKRVKGDDNKIVVFSFLNKQLY